MKNMRGRSQSAPDNVIGAKIFEMFHHTIDRQLYSLIQLTPFRISDKRILGSQKPQILFHFNRLPTENMLAEAYENI
jgi:hypothetical protein